MYARFPDRAAFNELLQMYMQQTAAAAAQTGAPLNIQFLPQKPKQPSFFMRGSASAASSSFAPAIAGQMAEAQQAEFGPGASPLGEPLIYSATGATQTPQQRRRETEQAFAQGAFRDRPQLALPMSRHQADMHKAREVIMASHFNTGVPVGAMLTDPRGAAYRRIARK